MQDDTAPPATTPSLSETISSLVATPAAVSSTNDARGTPLGVGDTTFVGTQRRIALMLLWIMIGVIIIITFVSLGYSVSCSFTGACDNSNKALEMMNNSLSPIFTAMIGLVGSVVGFYFGSKQSSS